jgi:hypothetical protein
MPQFAGRNVQEKYSIRDYPELRKTTTKSPGISENPGVLVYKKRKGN